MTNLVMTDGAVAGLLEPTSVELTPGEVVVAVGRPGHGNVALALALAGRLRLTGGTVALGEDASPGVLQAAVVLVDVPGVTEPDDSVPFRVVVAEELALAGRPAGPRSASSWLRAHRLGTGPGLRTEDVPPADRVRSLTELGAARPDARFLVLVSPDRHGLHRRDWWPPVRAAADAGLGVLVTVSEAVDLTGEVVRRATIGGAA
ncbi:hypothetical protein [Nocardioides nitrophenolicus]|uniref:hypothetical protein n=1 Tax=Nocardioides nitrophenolicus TaxID=60489 RepID=UPI00195CA524|nr:hypothetical protein [Nocardioides nitrophenolicus]MBM7515210.1 energy-coupling factor transporter ATP-binding protein EcfA2 [Nocardioides nitrophenolicus]